MRFKFYAAYILLNFIFHSSTYAVEAGPGSVERAFANTEVEDSSGFVELSSIKRIPEISQRLFFSEFVDQIRAGRIPFERAEFCGEQNYLAEEFNQLRLADKAKDYIETRAQNSDATVPRACVFTAMKFIREVLPVSSFVRCESNVGIPKQVGLKPCLTEEMVNVSYNTFVDVTSCLGLNQKLVLPKLMNESGFLLNSFATLRLIPVEITYDKDGNATKTPGKIMKEVGPDGVETPLALEKVISILDKQRIENSKTNRPTREFKIVGGDGGIGQFTGSAISFINGNEKDGRPYAESLRHIHESSQPACRRLSQFIKAVDLPEVIPSDLYNRCSMLKIPQNPVLSLIFSATYFKQVTKEVDAFWRVLNVDELTKQARAEVLDVAKIKEMLAILSYNAGSGAAVRYYANWLKFRSRFKNEFPITKADINFYERSSVMDSQNSERPKKLIELVGTEADRYLEELTLLKRTAHLDEVHQKRLSYLKSLGLENLDFGTHMMIYRQENRAARGYLYGIREQAKDLERILGVGVCSDRNFLSLQ